MTGIDMKDVLICWKKAGAKLEDFCYSVAWRWSDFIGDTDDVVCHGPPEAFSYGDGGQVDPDERPMTALTMMERMMDYRYWRKEKE